MAQPAFRSQVFPPSLCSSIATPHRLLCASDGGLQLSCWGDKDAAVWILQGYHDNKARHLLMLQIRQFGKVKLCAPHRHKWIVNH